MDHKTELLTKESTTFAENPIADYNDRRDPMVAFWKGANGRQPGDPSKLAKALIQIAGEAKPPRRFLAGADAVTTGEQASAKLLDEAGAYRDLSSSLGFSTPA